MSVDSVTAGLLLSAIDGSEESINNAADFYKEIKKHETSGPTKEARDFFCN